MSFLHSSPIEAAPQRWTSRCVPDIDTAWPDCGATRLPASELKLSFSVSRDEEFVGLRIAGGGRAYDLGSRNHNYLLLTLARRRLSDIGAGHPPEASGWIRPGEFAHDPAMDACRVNLDVHRIRQQFAKVGFVDAMSVIERRRHAGQLRIGTGHIAIVRV